MPQQARHLGRTRAEHDGPRVLQSLLHPEHELEQKGIVRVHRAAHVAEEHEPRLADLPLRPCQLDDVHAGAGVPAQRLAEVDPRSAQRGPPAPTRAGREVHHELAQDATRVGRLPDPVPDEGLVPADLVPAPLAGAPEYVGRLLRQLFLIVVGTRLKLELPCDHLGCRLAVPERLEDSIEERLLVVTADEVRAEGQAELVARRDADVVERTEDVDDPARRDAEPEAAEQATEHQHAFMEPARGRHFHAGSAALAASTRPSTTFAPPIVRRRWTSSWYLRRQPAVSSSVAPLTSPTRMPTSARLQSRVSAIPGRL